MKRHVPGALKITVLKNAFSESISPPHAQSYVVPRWGSGSVLGRGVGVSSVCVRGRVGFLRV